MDTEKKEQSGPPPLFAKENGFLFLFQTISYFSGISRFFGVLAYQIGYSVVLKQGRRESFLFTLYNNIRMRFMNIDISFFHRKGIQTKQRSSNNKSNL